MTSENVGRRETGRKVRAIGQRISDLAFKARCFGGSRTDSVVVDRAIALAQRAAAAFLDAGIAIELGRVEVVARGQPAAPVPLFDRDPAPAAPPRSGTTTRDPWPEGTIVRICTRCHVRWPGDVSPDVCPRCGNPEFGVYRVPDGGGLGRSGPPPELGPHAEPLDVAALADAARAAAPPAVEVVPICPNGCTVTVERGEGVGHVVELTPEPVEPEPEPVEPEPEPVEPEPVAAIPAAASPVVAAGRPVAGKPEIRGMRAFDVVMTGADEPQWLARVWTQNPADAERFAAAAFGGDRIKSRYAHARFKAAAKAHSKRLVEVGGERWVVASPYFGGDAAAADAAKPVPELWLDPDDELADDELADDGDLFDVHFVEEFGDPRPVHWLGRIVADEGEQQARGWFEDLMDYGITPDEPRGDFIAKAASLDNDRTVKALGGLVAHRPAWLGESVLACVTPKALHLFGLALGPDNELVKSPPAAVEPAAPPPELVLAVESGQMVAVEPAKPAKPAKGKGKGKGKPAPEPAPAAVDPAAPPPPPVAPTRSIPWDFSVNHKGRERWVARIEGTSIDAARADLEELIAAVDHADADGPDPARPRLAWMNRGAETPARDAGDWKECTLDEDGPNRRRVKVKFDRDNWEAVGLVRPWVDPAYGADDGPATVETLAPGYVDAILRRAVGINRPDAAERWSHRRAVGMSDANLAAAIAWEFSCLVADDPAADRKDGYKVAWGMAAAELSFELVYGDRLAAGKYAPVRLAGDELVARVRAVEKIPAATHGMPDHAWLFSDRVFEMPMYAIVGPAKVLEVLADPGDTDRDGVEVERIDGHRIPDGIEVRRMAPATAKAK